VTTANSSVGLPATHAPAPDTAHIVPSPATLQRFLARPGEGPGNWVDYRQHPAYRALGVSADLKARAASLLTFTKYFGVILCKRLISYELILGDLRKPRSFGGVLRLLAAATVNMLRTLVPRSPSRGVPSPVHAALDTEGVCVVQIAPQHLSVISAAAQPLFDQLRRVRGNKDEGGRDFDESRSSARRAANADLFAAVEIMLQTSGILAGVSGYIGRRAALVDVNPQINDPSDDFWRRIFPDLPDAERPAAYFHRDASGDIKAILYLSDVGPENGAFSFAVGTHRVRQGKLVDRIEETNDQSAGSRTGPLNRASFAALPRVLQRKCAVGNDLLPGTEIMQRLLGAEWSITAARGHIVLFDTKGFHRGGMVRQGERVVLTCVMG
jgi:hypothetical protein